jgi:hypothetical protein
MLTPIRSTNRRSLAALTLICLLGFAAPAAQADPILVDNFSTAVAAPLGFGVPGQSLVAGGTTGTLTEGPPLSGVIGGLSATRETTLTFGAGVGTVSLTIGGGAAAYTSTGTANGDFSLLYDATNSLVIDLTDSATNNRLLVGVGANTAGTPVTVTLVDDAMQFAALTVLTTGSAADLQFLFTSFTGVNPLLDLTQIESILVGVNPGAGASITLTGIVVTPEPASVLLFATVGLAAFSLRRRNRKR